MRVLVSGPRHGLTANLKLPHLHVELDLEELPKRGDVMILNSGSSYTVTDIMWWFDGPENNDYWDYDADYRTNEGRFQTVHIMVDPDRKPRNYPAEAAERGYATGRASAVSELSGRIAELRTGMHADPEIVLAVVESWLKANADNEGKADHA